jgi:hypothetical protein
MFTNSTTFISNLSYHFTSAVSPLFLTAPALAKLARVCFPFRLSSRTISHSSCELTDRAYLFLYFYLPTGIQYSCPPSLSTSLSRVSEAHHYSSPSTFTSQSQIPLFLNGVFGIELNPTPFPILPRYQFPHPCQYRLPAPDASNTQASVVSCRVLAVKIH